MGGEDLRINEFYAQAERPVISFEVFPPKTDQAHRHLLAVLPELAALKPDFMTVTYGALGSTRERTLEIAGLIQNKFGLPTACHLTCVGSSRSELDRILENIHDVGIRNIVALRGDPPKGQSVFAPPEDGLAHANDLVAHIRQLERRRGWAPFGIAVAGYPEKHLEAPDFATDLANLKRKADAGADAIITQLFYDNEVFFRFVEAARRIGISQPIIPGLLPIGSAKQIVRITSMCGACLPADLRADLEAAGEDSIKAEEIGVQRCIAQAGGLLADYAPGIHFYVLNRAVHMARIMTRIRELQSAGEA